MNVAVQFTSISCCVVPEKVDENDNLSPSTKLTTLVSFATCVVLLLKVTVIVVFVPFFLNVYVRDPVGSNVAVAVLFINA